MRKYPPTLHALAVTVLLVTAAATPSFAGIRSGDLGRADFAPYRTPTARYVDGSCLIDLSHIPDYTERRKVGGCGTHVTLSKAFVKLSVPHTWLTWSCPPRVEKCKPDVLYSDRDTSATIDFGTIVTTGGFECEPAFGELTVTVQFYSGPYGSGALVGTISRTIDHYADARLFAAKAKTGFQSAVVTTDPDGDFGIARIRL